MRDVLKMTSGKESSFSLAALRELVLLLFAASGCFAETLYNGIRLSDEWPPVIDRADRRPMRVPYLEKGNHPDVVPIGIGRQLFVDDFLVESMEGIERVYGRPKKHVANPVLKPETPWELNTPFNSTARPCGGGLWWDEKAKRFHLWYEAGWCGEVCYAFSTDGLRWERPSLDVVLGTNKVLPGEHIDSWSVVLDPSAPESERWKFFCGSDYAREDGFAYVSADGIHWKDRRVTGVCGDRSTLFYNPFRRKWVWSIRSGWQSMTRSRIYREHEDFARGLTWDLVENPVPTRECVAWLAADELDVQEGRPNENRRASLYNFDAVAYESIMLGAWEAHWGPENEDCEKAGLPKITDLQFAYSRDGFHFSRPDRTPAIASERWSSGKWDTGYVQSIPNLLVIKGDELWFYYSAFRGDPTRKTKCFDGTVPGACNGRLNGMYANGAMGLATMRRDGFVGLRAGKSGSVMTCPVRFGGRRLFVNLDAPEGALKVSVVARDGRELKAFEPVKGNRTKLEVGDVGELAGQDVRFRFDISGGTLYSFWVAKDADGKSGGYLAGGGPGYAGLRDE